MDPLLVIAHEDISAADREELEAALGVLRAERSVEVEFTAGVGDLDGVLHRAGSRIIVIAGGDGSLHAVIAALYRRRELGTSTLAILPLGTGNDFAARLEIPPDCAEAARVILDDVREPMDLIVDEVGTITVNAVHIGASAMASRRATRWKERLKKVRIGKVSLGKVGYPIGAVLTAWDPPVIRVRVEVDGEVVSDFDEAILMVAIGNGTRVGGRLELTPDADPTDGRLAVMISTATGGLSRLAYAVSLSRASHEQRDDVISEHAKTVSVSGEEFYCSADGEIYGPERRRTWRIEPDAYTMIVPAHSDVAEDSDG